MNTTFRILALAVGLALPSRTLAAESVVPLEELPRSISSAITENIGGGALERVTRDDAQGTVIYTAHYRDAQDKTVHAIRISREGRVLAEGPSTSEPPVGTPSTGVPLIGAPPVNGAKP